MAGVSGTKTIDNGICSGEAQKAIYVLLTSVIDTCKSLM